MNSSVTNKSTLTRQTFESERPLNSMEKGGGGFLDNTFKLTSYRKRRLSSKLPAPVIIPSPIIISHKTSPLPSPKSDSSSYLINNNNNIPSQIPNTKRFVLKPITALTAAFQRTTITGRKSSTTMTLLRFPKSQSNNNNITKSSSKPIPTKSTSYSTPKSPKSPKLLHRKGSSGSIRKRSESPTTGPITTTTVSLNNNNNSQLSINSKSTFRFVKPSSVNTTTNITTTTNINNIITTTNNSSTIPKSPSKLGKFKQRPISSCRKALPLTPSEFVERLRESSSRSAKFEEERVQCCYYDENDGSIIKPYLNNRLPKPIIIDVRNLSLYQNEHIRDSFNVNLPTLLIKRFRRGNMSNNLSLDSFITTPDGKDKYLEIINEDGGKYHHDVIIFDETMDETDKVSPGWTLLNVLEKVMFSYNNNINSSSDSINEIKEIPRGKVYWLKGGFEAFRSWDQRGEFIVTDSDNDDGLMDYEGQEQQGANLVRKDSLFSVDTEKNSLKSKKSIKRPYPSLDINVHNQQQQQQQQQLQQQQKHQPPQLQLQPIPSETVGTRVPSNGLQCDGEFHPSASNDFPNNDYDNPPPLTHPEIAFEVSTIIPGFLFLGPEITKDEEVKELKDRGVKRILNMAIECDDSSLKGKFDRYLKLNVKDSVEEDVENGLKIAVNFIERAKKDNTPIYVHCKAGRSRSVTAVLAYLIKTNRWELKHAYDYVMERRSSICPNIGFVAELMRIEEEVLGFKRNGGAVSKSNNNEKETMDMEGVEH